MRKGAAAILIALGVLVLLLAAGGTVFYLRVYAPNAPLIFLSSVDKLEQSRLRQKDFHPPAQETLTNVQVTEFLAVEQAVDDRLGARFAAVREASDRLIPRDGGEVRSVPARLALPAFGSIRHAFLDAKMAQIDALNAAGLSKEEFEWLRRRIYRAAGLRFRQLDLSDVLADASTGVLRIRTRGLEDSADERSADAARPLADRLERWLPLAFWGL